MDILVDSNNDAVFINGPLTSAGVSDYPVGTTAQRLKMRLLTFMGEWVFNTIYGPPYWQRILGKKIRKADLDAIFQQQILLEVGVKEIISFSSTFEKRIYTCNFRVKCNNGEVTEVISISPTL